MPVLETTGSPEVIIQRAHDILSNLQNYTQLKNKRVVKTECINVGSAVCT